jgi:hypothetical protein
MPTEEERAAEYRAQLQRRITADKQRREALAGDPDAKAALTAAWAPALSFARSPDPLGLRAGPLGHLAPPPTIDY